MSAAEPAFRPGDTGRPLRRYWRGPTWLFATRFAVDGLLRAGREDAARDLAARTAALVLREGFREYYDPYTGRGLGARAFGVSAIALDCAAARRGRLPRAPDAPGEAAAGGARSRGGAAAPRGAGEARSVPGRR